MKKVLMILALAFTGIAGCADSEPTVIGAGDQDAFTDPNLNPGMNENYEAIDPAEEE
ncbi:MAG: hypothetical protein AAGJ40_05185 [Planctomycetota bacterium]